MAKRLFDLWGSGLGLLLLAPFLLLMAIAIKLDSPGPVFFRQVRVGRDGVEFRIHKFRTMTHRDAGADAATAQITIGADPRITRVGELLRRTKLDELAQLIDVFVGRMSLVGPRPEVPRYVALYPKQLRDKVLSVRPGITDPASLAYRDESAQLARAVNPEREYVEVLLPAKLQLSVRYVEEASFTGDLRLIAATLHALLMRKPPSR
jgi:lipopolysaccharide/colanic/teichoic acid biosynthesis glycosyltransferase